MATSLARQLKSIRSDITATLDKRKFEKVSSLLFEPDEAAVQDFDTVLALGQNGLHGLIQIDPRFQKFEQTLFSDTAKGIDRAIQVCCFLVGDVFLRLDESRE
jgi:U3 small nucleolar RNA-associated protein 10